MQLNRRTTGNRRFRERATAILASGGALAMTTGFLMMAATGPAGADPAPHDGDIRGDSVAICHSTGEPDKWVYQGPDGNGVVHGHAGDHHHEGRDVIPAFTYEVFENGQWVEKRFPGQNLDKVDTIAKDGCEVPLIKVTPVLYTAMPATCDADGELEPQVQPAGVTAEQDPWGTGPGRYEIEFEAQDGYTLVGEEKQRITVEERKTGAECDGSSEAKHVTYVPPTVSAATCTSPAGYTRNRQPAGVEESFVQDPANPLRYTFTYSLSDTTAYVWTDGSTVTKQVVIDLDDVIPPQSTDLNAPCFVPVKVMPVEPKVEPARCLQAGSFTRQTQSPGVKETYVEHSAWTFTFTYTLTDTAFYAWADGGTAPRTVIVTLEKAKPEQSTDPDGDCYKAPGGGSGNPGNATDKPSPTVPTPTVPTPTVPTPTVPSPTVPSPTVPTPTVPGENPGGDGGQQPAADKCRNIAGIQHTVPEGLVVKGDGFCAKPTEIKGTETSAPHPDKGGPNQPGPDQQGPNRPGPTTKGVAGVPTAFPAGVPGTAADTGAAGTRAGAPALLAQLLVAGGLLLMVAAGGLQLRRPERGVHEI